MTIIQIYTSTTDVEEDVNKCYGQVQLEIDRMCKQYTLIVVGAWKGKVVNIKEANLAGLYDLQNQNEAVE